MHCILCHRYPRVVSNEILLCFLAVFTDTQQCTCSWTSMHLRVRLGVVDAVKPPTFLMLHLTHLDFILLSSCYDFVNHSMCWACLQTSVSISYFCFYPQKSFFVCNFWMKRLFLILPCFGDVFDAKKGHLWPGQCNVTPSFVFCWGFGSEGVKRVWASSNRSGIVNVCSAF